MYAIEAPASAGPVRGGLLQVLTPITDADPQLFYQGVTYQADLCGHSRPVPEEGVEKTFDELPVVTGEAFRIYRGIEMSLFQHSQAEEAVRQAYIAGEQWAVERAVQVTLLNPNAVDITPTPGTPVSGKIAMGLAEQYAADNYSGLPLLHTNRFGTGLLPDVEVDQSTWRAHSKQGTPIVNGGGYGAVGPGGASAPANSAWLYVTGQVHLWRQEFVVTTDAYALKQNRTYALAEGQYVSAVDCFVAAILVGI